MLQCLERTGKTAVLGFGPEELIIVQRPSASSVQHVPTWSRLSYQRLGINLLNWQSVTVEVTLSVLTSVLRAVEGQTAGRLIIRSESMLILSRVAHTSAEAEDLDIDLPGVMSHELLITPINGAALSTSLLNEPVVARPAIAFNLSSKSVAPLRGRLSRLGRNGVVRISANGAGMLILRIEGALLNVSITLKVRVLPGITDDPHRLTQMLVSLEQLLRVLSHASLLPTCTTLCALIPGQAMVLSVAISDDNDSLTFYIPPFDDA